MTEGVRAAAAWVAMTVVAVVGGLTVSPVVLWLWLATNVVFIGFVVARVVARRRMGQAAPMERPAQRASITGALVVIVLGLACAVAPWGADWEAMRAVGLAVALAGVWWISETLSAP